MFIVATHSAPISQNTCPASTPPMLRRKSAKPHPQSELLRIVLQMAQKLLPQQSRISSSQEPGQKSTSSARKRGFTRGGRKKTTPSPQKSNKFTRGRDITPVRTHHELVASTDIAPDIAAPGVQYTGEAVWGSGVAVDWYGDPSSKSIGLVTWTWVAIPIQGFDGLD